VLLVVLASCPTAAVRGSMAAALPAPNAAALLQFLSGPAYR
jgi:hypothetical protein